MRKVFSVLAVVASLFVGGWAQEAGAQATHTFTVSHTFTSQQKGEGKLANVADGASGKDAVIDFEITGDLSGLVITDVDLQLDLRHAEIGELAAHVAHPDGTTQVELFNRLRRDGNSNDGSCSPNTDVLNVTFDDGGQALSCTTSSISTGRRRPTSQALSGFNGKALNDGADRTWQLVVRDIVLNNNGGDLQSTALTIVAEESGILISLTSDDSDNIINEGESVTFTVTLSEAASGSDVSVPITITPSSAAIAHTTSGLTGGNLIIRDGSAIGTFSVTATEDNVGEPNGAITVALGTAPTDHINSNSANSVTFTVIDDDYIRISLTSGDSDDTITEGESVTFTVTLAEAASGSDVNVPITITPSSATIAHTTSGLNGGNLIIRDGSAIGTFSVMATEDTMNELDGTLTVTLGAAPGGYANDYFTNSVTITVYDNDGPPVMTIKGFARNESPYVTVVEGEDVVIVLELDKPAPSSTTTAIRAALRVGNSHGLTTSTSQGDFDATAFETAYSVPDLFNQVEWEFAEGTQELTIRIRTVDDSTAREFTENAAYPMFGASNLDVGHPFSGLFTIPIYIIDNDPMPITVFAEPVTASISEGQPARFKIRSNREAHSTAPALTVNYSVTQTGSFAAGNLPTNQNITIPAQMNETAEISIPTATDCSASSSGSITLTINEPTMGGTAFGYTVPTPAATVQIGEGGGGGPTVDISGGSDITEGTSATFTLALNCAVSGNVTVNVATDEVSGGQFLDPTPGVQPTQITFTSGGVTTRTFDVPTDDDMIDETNGSVSARITAGTGYDIGSDATATVNVADNDVPTITITAHDFVHEGDTILFTVISDIELANNLVVQLRRDEPDSGTTITIGNMSVTTAGEDYTAGDSLPGSITIPAGSAGTSAVYEVDTTNHRGSEGGHGYYIVEVLCPDRKNGDVGEGNCVIRDTANPPTDTTLSYMYQDLMEGDWTANDPSEKWVRINRVAKPGISIAASENTVNPGSDARFTVRANSFIPFGGLTVDIDLTESGDVTDTTTVPSLTFDYAGRTAAETAPGSMNFTVDTKAGSMGTLTAAFQSHTTYTFALGANSAQVTVETTQPAQPQIKLCRVADAGATACPGSPVSGSVSEGSELFFLVEITEAPPGGLSMNATISGDFLASGQAGVRVITIPGGMTASEVFTVATESADFIDEDDGTVTVSIANPDTETFGLATDEVTVDVTDAPFIDFCRVASSSATSCPDSALTGSIPENGGEAHFLVFLSTESGENEDVFLRSLSDTPRLARPGGTTRDLTSTVTILAGETRKVVTVRPFNNSVADTPANVEIRVTFHTFRAADQPTGYMLNPDKNLREVSGESVGGLTFNIIDDEAPPLPVITLCRIAPIGGTECPHTPVTGAIVEGQPAFFLFEISEAQSSVTNITVTVAETSGSFLAGGQAGVRIITIPATMTASGIFAVETQNDRSIGGNGEFTVTSANPDGARFTLAGAQHMVIVSNDDRMAMATGVGGEQSVQIEIYDLPLTHTVTAMAFDPETTGDGRPSAYTVPSAEETVFTHVVEIDISGGIPAQPFELCFPTPPLAPGEDPVIYYGGDTGSSWRLREDSYTNEEMVCTMTDSASFWAVGSVASSAVEQANKMILPRIAMAVAAETAGMIQDRIKDVFSGGGDSGVSVKGKSLQELIISSAQSGEAPELQLSDFAFSLAADDSYGGDWGAIPGRNISAWGRGYLLHMEDVGGSVEFDGTVTGGMAGVDTLFLSNLLVGVSGNLFSSEIDFGRSGTSRVTGTHETTAWSVHPYIGWQLSPRTTLWATGGYGIGSLEAAQDGEGCDTDRSAHCRESDATIITFGGGASGRMLDRRTAGGGRVVIDAIGDVVYARFIEDGDGGVNVDAGSARFGFELTGSRPAWWGSSLGGDLELAYRGDFGDDVKGSGLEAVGSVKFGVPRWGLRIDLGGRALISHSDNLRERGLSGDIMWSRSFDGTGPFLSFNPQWGATRSKSDTIWEHGVSEVEVETGAGRRYNMEAGYGVPLPYESGLMKVFARSEIVDGVVSSKIGGVDIEATGGISAGYEAVDETARTETEHRAYIRLNGTF